MGKGAAQVGKHQHHLGPEHWLKEHAEGHCQKERGKWEQLKDGLGGGATHPINTQGHGQRAGDLDEGGQILLDAKPEGLSVVTRDESAGSEQDRAFHRR